MDINGRTILVTRPESSGMELCRELTARGALPFFLPAIQIHLNPHSDAATRARAALCHADVLLLSSRHGLFGLGDMDGNRRTSLLVWAVGRSTARAAAERGFRVAIESSGGLDELCQQVIRRQGPQNLQVVWPRGQLADRRGIDRLMHYGLIVHDFVVYQTVDALRGTWLSEELLRNTAAVLLASPSAVFAFRETIPADAKAEFLERTCAVVIGPTTAEAASQVGFRWIAVARQPTNAALIAALLGA